MKIERFTDKAREALSDANELAKQYNNSRTDPRPRAQGAHGDTRLPARHRPESRRQVPGVGEIRAQPDRTGVTGQTRPGDRARRRDSPRHPGIEPPHEE